MKFPSTTNSYLNWVILPLVATLFSLSATPAITQTLKGGVEEENLRLTPGNGASEKGQAASLRLKRSPAAIAGSVVDSSAYMSAESPQRAPLDGLVNINDFSKLPRNFDIGTERESHQMVLAWERWHHQLSQTIYQRWQRIARRRGCATIRVTVTNDHHIVSEIIQSSGSPEFDNYVLDAITSLDGNPGLSFPSQSRRQHVSFEADYIAGTHVTPGYSWDKNDYEHIRDDR